MTAITFGLATGTILSDVRAVWNAIEDFVAAAVGAFAFAAIVWALLAMPGLFS